MLCDFEDFLAVSPTRERASHAFGCYSAICLLGVDKAKELYRKSTWYRHLAIMRDVGLTLNELHLHHLHCVEGQAVGQGVRLVRG